LLRPRLRIRIDPPRTGRENMALDAAMLDRRRSGDDPVLRIYRWRPAAVSAGYHQPESDFDLTAIADRGWDWVRRPTGGRAILHAEELTYAVAGDSPSTLFGEGLHDVYDRINRVLAAFLAGLGLHPDISDGESLAEARGAVCFRSAGRHELTVAGRKIVGSAQRRHDGKFLQHGSILTGPAHADLLQALIPERLPAGGRETLLMQTTHLSEQLGTTPDALDHDALAEALAEAFAAGFDLEPLRESAEAD